ncbi:MAG: hypothetical protein AAF830_16240 [Pseudomonadota bacterium]
MSLGNIALGIVIFATALYALALIMGFIAIFPVGLPGLVVLGVAGFLIGLGHFAANVMLRGRHKHGAYSFTFST